jgi:hypothetical protein
MTTFLTPNQVEGALRYLADNYVNPLVGAKREAWESVLPTLHEGELMPALASLPSKFRPEAYEVLEVILSKRPSQPPSLYKAPERDQWDGNPESVPALLEAKRKIGKCT